jgi:hypothetical protein
MLRVRAGIEAGSPLGLPDALTTGVEGKWESVWEHMRVRGRDCGSAGVRGASGGAHGRAPVLWSGRGRFGGPEWEYSGQANKGARWMPRHGPARKDVVSCEKRRGAAREL